MIDIQARWGMAALSVSRCGSVSRGKVRPRIEGDVTTHGLICQDWTQQGSTPPNSARQDKDALIFRSWATHVKTGPGSARLVAAGRSKAGYSETRNSDMKGLGLGRAGLNRA